MPEMVGIDVVSAFAGDRPMTQEESALVRQQQANRGADFFSDLIYAVAHHYVRPEQAHVLWDEVLSHKRTLAERLNRNVGITVAMLDYLSNITSNLKTPTLISEDRVSELVALSMRDGMTGLYNQSTCYELLMLELANHRRYGVGVALLLLDIDGFKLVNDEYGHQTGDRILVDLATVMTEEARSSDICCRLGGDEFIVILRLTNHAEEACAIAERIRSRAASASCGKKSITVSIGVALCDRATESARELVQRADKALYAAKRAGRNRVFLDTGGVSESIKRFERDAALDKKLIRAPQPKETSTEGSGIGRCRLCGHESRGIHDGYFRHAEFTCEQCGHVWTATLTDKQRWDLLHDREP